ncbi:MAG: ParA family protein [Deltaproteobacteria bacterium]|jgi:chromosome partitioning protein|nr:ParA family protein [Deltaproteobacteria bacterium]
MKKSICLSFLGLKGGSGKTIISTNIAYVLASAGNKVLVIDADPQGNATLTLSPKNKKDPGLFYPAMNEFLLDRGIGALDVIVTDTIDQNIHLLPNNLRAAQAALRIEPLVAIGQVMKRLQPIMQNYDYVIFDGRPEDAGLFINLAMICSDYVIVPIDGTYGASSLSALLDLIDDMKNWNAKLELLGVVLNHWMPQRIQAKQLKEYLKAQYPEVYVFNQTIPTSEQIRRTQVMGRTLPVVIGESISPSFKKLAKEIIKTIESREKEKNDQNTYLY